MTEPLPPSLPPHNSPLRLSAVITAKPVPETQAGAGGSTGGCHRVGRAFMEVAGSPLATPWWSEPRPGCKRSGEGPGGGSQARESRGPPPPGRQVTLTFRRPWAPRRTPRTPAPCCRKRRTSCWTTPPWRSRTASRMRPSWLAPRGGHPRQVSGIGSGGGPPQEAGGGG